MAGVVPSRTYVHTNTYSPGTVINGSAMSIIEGSSVVGVVVAGAGEGAGDDAEDGAGAGAGADVEVVGDEVPCGEAGCEFFTTGFGAGAAYDCDGVWLGVYGFLLVVAAAGADSFGLGVATDA